MNVKQVKVQFVISGDSTSVVWNMSLDNGLTLNGTAATDSDSTVGAKFDDGHGTQYGVNNTGAEVSRSDGTREILTASSDWSGVLGLKDEHTADDGSVFTAGITSDAQGNLGYKQALSSEDVLSLGTDLLGGTVFDLTHNFGSGEKLELTKDKDGNYILKIPANGSDGNGEIDVSAGNGKDPVLSGSGSGAAGSSDFSKVPVFEFKISPEILNQIKFGSELNFGSIDSSVYSQFELGYNYVDPLAIDLDGDGIETVSNSAGVLFDNDADGIKTGTGWISADDGLLVLNS